MSTRSIVQSVVAQGSRSGWLRALISGLALSTAFVAGCGTGPDEGSGTAGTNGTAGTGGSQTTGAAGTTGNGGQTAGTSGGAGTSGED